MSIAKNTTGGGGDMLRVRYVPHIQMGFWFRNFLNKGPLFNNFSLNMGGFSRNWQKLVKNGQFSAKIHHKSGYDGNCP